MCDVNLAKRKSYVHVYNYYGILYYGMHTVYYYGIIVEFYRKDAERTNLIIHLSKYFM